MDDKFITNLNIEKYPNTNISPYFYVDHPVFYDDFPNLSLKDLTVKYPIPEEYKIDKYSLPSRILHYPEKYVEEVMKDINNSIAEAIIKSAPPVIISSDKWSIKEFNLNYLKMKLINVQYNSKTKQFPKKDRRKIKNLKRKIKKLQRIKEEST